MFHRSERLLLRPGWIEDAGELTARIADERIIRNLARAPWPYSQQDATGWLTRQSEPMMPSLLLTLPSAQHAPIVGGCGLHEGERGAEIGYWIAREWWGKGFATEAARAVLSIARALGHRQIFACHAFDNPASGRVLRKAGFVPTGATRSYHSLGRGVEIAAPEYVTDLGVAMGDDGPSAMPQAA